MTIRQSWGDGPARGERLGAERVQALANAVRAKILASSDLLAASEGEITIRIFPRGVGFDIKITATTL